MSHKERFKQCFAQLNNAINFSNHPWLSIESSGLTLLQLEVVASKSLWRWLKLLYRSLLAFVFYPSKSFNRIKSVRIITRPSLNWKEKIDLSTCSINKKIPRLIHKHSVTKYFGFENVANIFFLINSLLLLKILYELGGRTRQEILLISLGNI